MSANVDYAVTSGNVQVLGCSNGNPSAGQEDTENPENNLDKHDRTKCYWWNPKMDSVSLEKQFQESNGRLVRESIHEAIVFWTFSFLLYSVYFFSLAGSGGAMDEWLPGALWSIILAVIYVAVYFIPSKSYKDRPVLHQNLFLSIIILTPLIVTSLTSAYFVKMPVMSVVGTYLFASQVILCIYLILPVHTLIVVAITLGHSIVFEVLIAPTQGSSAADIAFRILYHFLVHVIGWCMTIRVRSIDCDIFWKVCRMTRSEQAKCRETSFKNLMIKSVMPLSIADEIFSNEDENDEEDEEQKKDDGRLFRSFIMKQMDDVSILYADIVGFTQMSSNKTAAELVGLLNDLFGRFDQLCEITGCEKISTLGDCYYCVAGCPQPRDDHAICCVEMGLGMIEAIKDFCLANNTSVNMRVGVHTGRVMCGIIGTKRYKFDVFSNDVSLANGMEQHGVPGRIHVTEATLKCLQDRFVVEDSNLKERSPSFEEKAGKTYFIVSRRDAADAQKPGDASAVTSEGDIAGNGTSEHLKANWKIATKSDAVMTMNQQSTTPLLNEQHEQATETESSKQEPPLVTAVSPPSPKVLISAAAGGESAAPSPGRYSTASTRSNGGGGVGGYKQPNASDLKQDQLMEYLGQCVSPLTRPGPGVLSRIRDDDDQKFLDTIKDEKLFKDSYRYYSDINPVTMHFKDAFLEQGYVVLGDEVEYETGTHPTHSKRSHFIQDSATVFFLTICLFILAFLQMAKGDDKPAAWITVLAIIIVTHIVLILYLFQTRHSPPPPRVKMPDRGVERRRAVGERKRPQPIDIEFTVWSFWCRQIIGVLSLITPAVLLLSFISCSSIVAAPPCDSFLLLAGLVVLVCCSFTELYCWIRCALAFIFTIVFVSIYYAMKSCGTSDAAGVAQGLCTGGLPSSKRFEYVIVFPLLFIFVSFVGRCFELRNRLLFQCKYQILKSDGYMEREKRRVETLLQNFIPPHVRRDMKDQNVYSKTHRKVGVIFGTIVNFNELYDEDYAGGMEFIRILSELISDFDDLLDLPEFNHIDKVKTIGTTMMLASGLNIDNEKSEEEARAHLKQLMEFCISMQNVVDSFNKDLLNFQLVLRIGFNHGEITAGVIGTTKRLYDIWGDTVNTASRMDSTGVPGRVQVSEESKKMLENDYNFQHIGEKFVKGKGRMETYLLVRDDEDSRVIIPNPCANYEPF